MKRQSTILAVLACSAIAIGCGSSGGNSASVPLDTTGDGSTDATGGGTDTTGGTDGFTGNDGTTGDTSGDATTGTDASDPCSCEGKECGFIPNCSVSCGFCTGGKTCKANKCEGAQTVNLKKFGEWCGPSKDCQPPPAGTASNSPAAAAYRDCLNAQCDTNLCNNNHCTKFCAIAADTKDNASGAAGADGIEDAGANSECADAVDGPHGDKYACTELRTQAQVAQQGSLAICSPAGSWKACKVDTDCGAAETCRLYSVYGVVKAACGPKSKNPDKSTGAKVTQLCNNNVVTGPVAICENNFCTGLGCTSFCNEDTDCISSPGACKAGKCANGEDCKGDVDCSAWRCDKGVKLDDSDPTLFNICWPKNCEIDSDCKSDNAYCRISYNGVDNPEGDPDPKDPTKIKKPGWAHICMNKPVNAAKKGEACDPYADDDTSLPECGIFTCAGGYCGSLCKGDGDCPATMTCGTSEIPFDLDDPQDDIDDLYLAVGRCLPTPGKAGACTAKTDCKDGKYCKLLEQPVSLPAGATPVGYSYVMNGLCIEPDKAKKALGEECGPAAMATGLGKVCQSDLCLNTQNAAGDAQPGFCADTCAAGKVDCPATMTAYGQQYKTVCRSLLWGWNLTKDPTDDIYVPVCWPAGSTESLTDCATTKACTGNLEACVGMAVATGPDKAAKTEYLCRSVANQPTQANQNPAQPTKKVGEKCNPDATSNECLNLYCLDDVKAGEGYCSRTCNEDADCGSGLVCDKGNMLIARKDVSKAAVMPICRKVKSCIPCIYDFQCGGGYKCTNLGGGGTLANQRCAPACSTDADCANADSGATKCTPAKDGDGKELGHKVCAPTAAFCQ